MGALSNVASDTREQTPGASDEFSKRNLQTNDSAALMKPRQFNAFPVDVPLTGLKVSPQGLFMNVSQIFGHQHRYGLAKHFWNGVSKDPFGRGIHEEDGAVLIYRDDCVGGRLCDDAEARFKILRDLLHLCL